MARWTGEHRFTLDQVLKEMTGRCRELGLRVTLPEGKLKHEFAIVLAVHTMRCLLRPGEWCQL